MPRHRDHEHNVDEEYLSSTRDDHYGDDPYDEASRYGSSCRESDFSQPIHGHAYGLGDSEAPDTRQGAIAYSGGHRELQDQQTVTPIGELPDTDDTETWTRFIKDPPDRGLGADKRFHHDESDVDRISSMLNEISLPSRVDDSIYISKSVLQTHLESQCLG